VRQILLIPFFVVLLWVSAVSAVAQEIDDDWNFPEARQFDFWIGEWQVQNRFKQADNSWKDEGGAKVKIFPVLDGKAVMEFWSGTAKALKETKGFSLRYFDTETQKWKLALNWPQPNNGGYFFLDGEFRHHRGEFFVKYKNQSGDSVINRYSFSDITPTSLRWNDGTSLDDGKTWETSWIMEFSRTADAPQWPSVDDSFPTYDNDSWNTTDKGKRFDNLPGLWKGKMEISGADGNAAHNVEIKAWKVLNGAAYLLELHATDGSFKEILMLTYREMNNLWLLLTLDNRRESGFNVFAWKAIDVGPVFRKLPRDPEADVKIEWSQPSMNQIELIKIDGTRNMTTRLRFEK
jgi:hypothetical protein